MLHEALWRANQDLARACLDHPFVQGLASGSLAAARFGAYVAQDAFFLRAFLQAWALALARAADPEPFRDLLNGAADELRLHRAYAAQLSLDLRQGVMAARIPPRSSCQAVWSRKSV